jgi:alanyl-tRNA synthetase
LRIVAEGAVAQGIRRIEAVTGEAAAGLTRAREKVLEKAAAVLKASPEDLALRVEQQQKRVKELQKEVSDLNFDVIRAGLDDVLARADRSGSSVIVAHVFKNVDIDTLRRVSDLLKQKCPSSVHILGGANGADEAVLLVTVTDDLVAKGVKAGDVVQKIAPVISGSGGGRPVMAQAGGKEPGKLGEAVDKAKQLVKGMI